MISADIADRKAGSLAYELVAEAYRLREDR